MEVDSSLLPLAWLKSANVVMTLLLIAAAWSAPWHRLREPEMQHAWFGAMVALSVLWWIRAGIVPGLGFHFFGVTTLTLMFGWQLALLAGPAVLAAGIWTGHGDWQALGMNTLVLFGLPVTVTWTMHRLACRRLPWNFFVYVFINCYLAAVLSMALATICMTGLQVAAGQVSAAYLFSDYLPFLPMLLLSEGFINGTVIAVLVATRPGWVWTFDDKRYLRKGT
jgi:uncharacterized membrane protein